MAKITGPTVSVIIPLFNGKEVIGRTIESAVAQTYQDREIILVDDGSTDGSADIVKTFGHKVRYRHFENGGVAKARNRGIRLANGRFIALLDHDDLWAPTKLEKQVRFLERHPAIGMVVTDVAHIDRNGCLTGEIGRGFNPNENFARLFVHGYVPTPSAAMIRRSVFDKVGFFDERFHSAGLDDHELWARVAGDCDIAGIPEPLTFHRAGKKKSAAIGLEHRAILISTLLERFGWEREKRRYLLRERASYLSDLGKQQIRDGDRLSGFLSLREGFVLSLGEAKSWKTALRCLTRMARIY